MWIRWRFRLLPHPSGVPGTPPKPPKPITNIKERQVRGKFTLKFKLGRLSSKGQLKGLGNTSWRAPAQHLIGLVLQNVLIHKTMEHGLVLRVANLVQITVRAAFNGEPLFGRVGCRK